MNCSPLYPGSLEPGALLSLLATSPFPRGPGLYFNWATLLALLVVYGTWVHACYWVDQDARSRQIDRSKWNVLVFGGGVLGLVLFWIVPWFPLAFPLLILAVSGPLSYYIRLRNDLVPEEEKVWTKRHLKVCLKRYLGIKLPMDSDDPSGVVEFLARPEENGREIPRLILAQREPGFAATADFLRQALLRHADEIHLAPSREKTILNMRVDDAEHTLAELPRATGEVLYPVLKGLANLTITERRKPQDGYFPFEFRNDRYHCQVHAQGMLAGEHLHLQLRNLEASLPRIPDLGLPERQRESLLRALKLDRGILFLAGRRGSARTAAAWACVLELHTGPRPIIMFEDLLARRFTRIEQIRVTRKGNETRCGAMKRLFTRQEPHVIHLGQVSDPETAEWICELVNAGHFVIGSLGGADTVGGLSTLQDLEVPFTRFAKKLIGVLSPRYVRKLCSQCLVRYRPNEDLMRKVNLPADKVQTLSRPPDATEIPRDQTGALLICDSCGGTGYRGREPVCELLMVNDRIRELLRDDPPLPVIRQEAIRSGMATLEELILPMVLDGRTSIAEMVRSLQDGKGGD